MPIRPPTASRLANLFAMLADLATRLPSNRAWAFSLGGLACVVAFDAATGPRINPMPLYLMIGCFTSWCLGERPGLLVGFCTIGLDGLLNGHAIPGAAVSPGPTVAAEMWSIAGRGLVMMLIIGVSSGLRCALEQARWRATVDSLTGVLNKGAFTRRLDTLVAQTQRHNEALVLAYIDLDGFKAVNDSFGHAAGDVLLRHFADSAGEAIRAGDLFARMGGDEFIALLTVPDCPQGDIAAARLHGRLSQILRETEYDVTCSVGALVLDGHQVSQPERLVEAADGLMYEVKRSGKNALRVARAELQDSTQQGACVTLPGRRRPSTLARGAA